jgi:hypothetical protein
MPRFILAVKSEDIKSCLSVDNVVHPPLHTMSQEDYPVEFVLDSIESVMAPQKPPKVILFDIGGVCVRDDLPLILPMFWTMPCLDRFVSY